MAIPNKAITRNEQYLAAMAGQSGTLPDEPITRKEFYLAKAAGQEVETPEPITREEMYLDAIAKGGGGGGGGGGMTPAVKSALLNLMEHVAYTDEHGQEYYDALVAALNGGSTPDLESISAVFSQGSAVIYDTDGLETLRQYLTVTASYSDTTTKTVTDYTLSGTLAVGTSTITASYGGKTDTFSVTVSAKQPVIVNMGTNEIFSTGNYSYFTDNGVTAATSENYSDRSTSRRHISDDSFSADTNVTINVTYESGQAAAMANVFAYCYNPQNPTRYDYCEKLYNNPSSGSVTEVRDLNYVVKTGYHLVVVSRTQGSATVLVTAG